MRVLLDDFSSTWAEVSPVTLTAVTELLFEVKEISEDMEGVRNNTAPCWMSQKTRLSTTTAHVGVTPQT